MTDNRSEISHDELVAATQKIADALSNTFKRSVVIAFGSDEARGHAFFVEGNPIHIRLDAKALAGETSRERAFKIWRGLALQWIAHQMFPADGLYEAAGKDGCQNVFALLDDEHSIRKLIAIAPAEGQYLQSLVASSFPSVAASSPKIAVRRDFSGIMTGAPKAGTIAATATYGVRFNNFAYSFRRGITVTGEKTVECLSHIDSEFKDWSKDKVLEAARAIHAILAAGIELTAEEAAVAKPTVTPTAGPAKTTFAAPAGEPLKDEPADKQESQKEPPPPSGQHPVGMYFAGAMGLCAVGWTWLTLHLGYDLLTFMAGVLVIAGGFGLFGLWAARSAVKGALKEFFTAIAAGLDFIRGQAATKWILLGILVAAICVMVLIILTHVPYAILALCIGGLGIMGSLALGAKQIIDGPASADRLQASRITGGALMLSTALAATGYYYVLVGMGLPVIVIVPTLGLTAGVLFSCSLALMFQPSAETGKIDGIVGLLSQTGRGVFSAIIAGFRKLLVGGGYAAFGLGVVGAGILVVLKTIIGFIALVFLAIVQFTRLVAWKLEPSAMWLWSFPVTRIVTIAAPLGFIAAMAISVTHMDGGPSYILLLPVLAAAAAYVGILFWFGDKVLSFVSNQKFEPMSELIGNSTNVPVDKVTTEWPMIEGAPTPVVADAEVLAKLMPLVNTLVPRLRAKLESLGEKPRDKDEQADGDVGEHVDEVVTGNLDIYVGEHLVPLPSISFRAGVDCSDSVSGAKFERAVVLALVLENAFRGLTFIDYHGYGFNDSVIYDCGVDAGGASGLECRGGNNDTAMLWHMRQTVDTSKDIKILALLSDVQPADSSWRSLQDLMTQSVQDGFTPWQFLLDATLNPIENVMTTDAFHQSLEQVVDEIGDRIVALVEEHS